jgi:hypothetical protein
LQETLKAAPSAARSGDVQEDAAQYQAAIGVAISTDPALASGMAVEKADLLSANKLEPGAITSLIESAAALQSNGAPARLLVPIANRLSRLAMQVEAGNGTRL